MKIHSRYSDDPNVVIDSSKVPAEFQHLIPLAIEWCIGDDLELDEYIDAASEEEKRAFVNAFSPQFNALWEWHESCAGIIPQPDELVMFDNAAHAAATIYSCQFYDR
jgi:hypothetical protein